MGCTVIAFFYLSQQRASKCICHWPIHTPWWWWSCQERCSPGYQEKFWCSVLVKKSQGQPTQTNRGTNNSKDVFFAHNAQQGIPVQENIWFNVGKEDCILKGGIVSLAKSISLKECITVITPWLLTKWKTASLTALWWCNCFINHSVCFLNVYFHLC